MASQSCDGIFIIRSLFLFRQLTYTNSSQKGLRVKLALGFMICSPCIVLEYQNFYDYIFKED